MQVLLVGAHPSRGHGLRRLTAVLARAWEEAGAQVRVVTTPAAVSSRVPWRGAGRGLAAVESAAWVGRHLPRRGEDVDLVVVADPRDAVWTSSLAGRVPVTVVVHHLSGAFGAEPSTGAAATLHGGAQAAVDRLKTPILARALQRADHVLATSEAAARGVRRITEHAPAVLHPPVDPAVVVPDPRRSLRRNPAWPYLLSVDSSARPGSRAELLVAWANLRRTAVLDGASLVIVGPPLTSEEESLAVTCGGHLQVLQDVADESLGALYEGARAVLALGHSEGFAWSVAEAHAAGRPVLAADGNGYEEAGADGCLYLPTDGIMLFDHLAWTAIAEDLMSAGLLARARANGSRFTWQSFVSRLPAASVAPRIAHAAAHRPYPAPHQATIPAPVAQPGPAAAVAPERRTIDLASIEPVPDDLPAVGQGPVDVSLFDVPAPRSNDAVASAVSRLPRRREHVGS